MKFCLAIFVCSLALVSTAGAYPFYVGSVIIKDSTGNTFHSNIGSATEIVKLEVHPSWGCPEGTEFLYQLRLHSEFESSYFDPSVAFCVKGDELWREGYIVGERSGNFFTGRHWNSSNGLEQWFSIEKNEDKLTWNGKYGRGYEFSAELDLHED